MESFLPLSGFQLPFQQRLSRLYNDTKKSTDFVKDPVQNEEDPEVKALHRKLRIEYRNDGANPTNTHYRDLAGQVFAFVASDEARAIHGAIVSADNGLTTG
jgi:hypothetical protein